MEQIQQQIGILHTLFIVCLVLFVVFLAASILLFFLFHIWDVFNAMTGRSQRKAVREMNAQNEKTGQLRQNFATGATITEAPITTKPEKTDETPRPSASAGSGLPEQEAEAAATAVLAVETSVLSQELKENTVVKPAEGNAYSIEIAQSETDEQYGKFTILESILLIHTNEAV